MAVISGGFQGAFLAYRSLDGSGFGCVPACPVHEPDGVGFAGHVFANPVEVQLHGLGVDCWQNQRGACAPLRANGPEQTGVLITLTGGSAWSRPLAGPDARRSVLLPDPRFVVEPDLYRRFCGKTGSMRYQRVGNVFLKASIT